MPERENAGLHARRGWSSLLKRDRKTNCRPNDPDRQITTPRNEMQQDPLSDRVVRTGSQDGIERGR